MATSLSSRKSKAESDESWRFGYNDIRRPGKTPKAAGVSWHIAAPVYTQRPNPLARGKTEDELVDLVA